MKTIAAITVLSLFAGAGMADLVNVEINGSVWGNQVNNGALGTVNAGDTATISFQLDSDMFVDSASFPTRAFNIDLSSFNLSFSSGASLGAAPSFAGPAYFVLRNNDPVADGFFLSQGTDLPSGIPLDQVGVFGDFDVRFNVSYTGETLSSLDLLGAVGDYDYTGLTVFGMGVSDGPAEDVVGIDFTSMSISVVPAPGAASLLGLGALCAMRRRR